MGRMLLPPLPSAPFCLLLFLAIFGLSISNRNILGANPKFGRPLTNGTAVVVERKDNVTDAPKKVDAVKEGDGASGGRTILENQFDKIFEQVQQAPPNEEVRKEYLQKGEEVMKRNLTNDLEEPEDDEGTIDAWKDDVDALGMVVDDVEGKKKANVGKKEGEDEKGRKKAGKGKKTLAQKRARLCSDAISPLVPEILAQKVPFLVYNLGCYYKGGDNSGHREKKSADEKNEGELWAKVWDLSSDCRMDINETIQSQPNCHLVIGFVDNLFVMPESSFIAQITGPKLDKYNAVVRLLCGDHADAFLATFQAMYKPNVDNMDIRSNGESFLKTVFALEFTWYPGCIVVFFDSRTLDSSNGQMGRLLLNEPRLKFGTKDGRNEWAASKFICGKRQRAAFTAELNSMRIRNKDVPKELNVHDHKIRAVLGKKINEEMFPVYQVTAAPPSGFLKRLWDGLVG